MKLTLGDSTWRLDLSAMYYPKIGPAREIKRRTGMTIADWRNGLMLLSIREDPDVLAALLFLFRHRPGEAVDWAELDGVDSKAVLEGLELEDADRELLAATLPPEVDWMSLAKPTDDTGDGGSAEGADEPAPKDTT